MREVRERGIWYLGSSMMKPPPPPLVDRPAQHQRGDHRADDAGDVERRTAPAPAGRRPAPTLRGRDEGGDDHRIDRQPRRAGHQRRDQDRGQPVLGIVDGARRHDPGIAQAKLDSSGMKVRPDRPTPRHQPVHQEGGAGHVAGRFQHQDEEEQDQDLRQEHDHRADARRSRRRRSASAAGPSGSAARDRVAERRRCRLRAQSADGVAQANTAWNITNSSAARISGPATGCSSDRVEPVGAAAHRGFADDRRGGDRRGRGAGSVERRGWRLGAGRGARRDQQLPSASRSSSSPRRRTATVGITGTPSSRCERAAIEHQPVALGEVDHVERDHRRQPERDQLQREAQVVVEVGGVDHDQQRVGQRARRPARRAGRRG